MSIWCVGVYKKYLKGKTLAYLICDSEAVTEQKDNNGKMAKFVATRAVTVEGMYAAIKGGHQVENMDIVNGAVKITSGSEDRYACFNIDTKSFMGIGERGYKQCLVNGIVKMPFVIIAKDDNLGTHRAVMASGRIGDYKSELIIKDVEQGGRILSNAKVVSSNDKKYISMISGDIEHIDKVGELKQSASDRKNVDENKKEQVPENKTKQEVKQTGTPVTNKNPYISVPSGMTVNSNVTKKFGIDDLFEIKRSEKFGLYISKIKMYKKEEIDNIIGEGTVLKPFNYNGSIVRCIDALVFTKDFIDVGNSKFYVCGNPEDVDEYNNMFINRFAFDASGKAGFICVDTTDKFKSDNIGGTTTIIGIEQSVADTGGILVLPHVLANGSRPVSLKMSLLKSGRYICMLDNITEIFKHSLASASGVDLSRSNVTFIPEQAAYYNKDLLWIKFNHKIERIHKQAFAFCTMLKEVTLTKSMTEIADEAFMNSGLDSLKYEPGTAVTRISHKAFCDCRSLKDLDLGFVNGTLSNKVFYGCYNLKGTLVIPGTVTKVGVQSFGLTGISRFELGEGVVDLGAGFAYVGERCSFVKTITIKVPESLLTVGKLDSSTNVRYKVELRHGCRSDQAWMVEKARLGLDNINKSPKLELIYTGENLPESVESFRAMLDLMGKDNLVENFSTYGDENDTPFTLSELLNK